MTFQRLTKILLLKFKRSKDLRKGGTQCIFIEKIDQRENDTSLFFSTNNNIDGCVSFPKKISLGMN